MKTQATQWFNTKTMKPVYGIKVKHEGKWLNAAENGKPLLFDSEEERDRKRKEIRNRPLGCSRDPMNCERNEGHGCECS